MRKKISIIIPAKNEERFIGHCLESLSLIRTEKLDIQTIVVDNGSTDETCKISKRYGADVVSFPEGRTIGSIRNYGATFAEGEFLAFLDADCMVSNDWLLNAVRRLDHEIGAVGSRPIASLESSTWVQRSWGRIMPRSLDQPVFVDWLSSSNIFLRREMFDRINGFDERLETCEDVDLGFRLKRITKIVYAPDVKAIHLKEPRTLLDFFKKEVWHGKSLYKNIFQYRWFIREFKIIIIPLFCLINLTLVFLEIIIQNILWIFFAILFVSIPIIMTIRNIKRVKDPVTLCQCFLLNITFILGRSISILYYTFNLLFNKWIKRK